MNRDAHSVKDVQKLPQPITVDPSDLEFTDEDELVPAPREERKKLVEAITISSNFKFGAGEKPSPPKERRGGKRDDGRSFRMYGDSWGRVYLLRAVKRSARAPQRRTPV